MENYRTDLAVEIMNKIGGAREGAEVESADGGGGTKINRALSWSPMTWAAATPC